jgi:hypothetical protein
MLLIVTFYPAYRQAGFEFLIFHSVRNDFTGLAIAALIA